jgi:membrane associated rhomboid family serine protease
VLPRFRRGAFGLFALTFVVTMLLGDRATLADALTLEPGQVLAGHEWWTPLTSLFRYPEGLGLLGLLWTLVIQWVLGSRLEGFWGTTRYLVMVMVAGLLGYASSLGLALVVPGAASMSFAGAAPIDVAAAVAFTLVFAREQLQFGSVRVSPVWLGTIAASLALGFPMITAVFSPAATPAAQAWPSLVPGAVAGLVAVVFVQPWRKRDNSGKVGRSKGKSAASHLRVVRTPEDMLN